MLLVNLDFSSVSLPMHGTAYSDSQSKWNINGNVEEILMQFDT
jgi:hypothetical protein